MKAAAVEKMTESSFAAQPQALDPTSLPVRFQTPTYTLAEGTDPGSTLDADGDFIVKVGADISSSTGAVVLRDIMKKLAALKNMNISWASDVDQYSYVDVDIRANDDFFKAIDNLLRQRDYFHEVQGSTIVVKYKETRKFHLAMPFIASTYASSVGANVTATSNTTLSSAGNDPFDVWDNIRMNLDQVLNIWEEASSSEPPPDAEPTEEEGDEEPAEPIRVSRPQSAKGYYTIDKPIGLITVTAPRRIVEKVESYLNNLKEELYKQVNIEAKIIEVSISNSRDVGINWENLLNGVASQIGISTSIGSSTVNQPFGPKGNRSFTIAAPNFNVIVNALEQQGKTKVLANPRISVMNGQPALINVGKNVTYIDKVEVTIDEGIVTQEVTTAEASSGIVMSVVPTIMGKDEIILNLTPVTSQLEEPILYETFGQGKIGLPVINVREMSTLVRIKKGEMLVVGGLIDSIEDGEDTDVPLLGKLPIVGRLFSHDSKSIARKELVVLLRPNII
jgi:general secretion pathway protein D/MSHA biogenesis protein MshL